METEPHPSQEGGILDRMKRVVGGLTVGPKEHKVHHEEEHSEGYTLVASPKGQGTTESLSAAEAPAAPQQEKEAPKKIDVQKLIKPQEVEVGMEKPPVSESEAPSPAPSVPTPITTTTTTTTAMGAAPLIGAAATELPAPASPAPIQQPTHMARHLSPGEETPMERAVHDLEARGYRHTRSVSPTGAAGKRTEVETWAEAPREPKQGERVKVEREGMVRAPGAAGMKEVEARPTGEVTSIYGAEMAEMRAKEHELRAKERAAEITTKQAELQRLKEQTESLEAQSQALLEEAAKERQRIDTALAEKKKIEHVEWRGLALAERAEQERRVIAQRAVPAVTSADELVHDAQQLRLLSEDYRYHAQVLENRAKALVQESEDMALLAAQKTAEATAVAADLSLKRQQADEMKMQIETQAALGLPQFIEDCRREIGVLSRRIAELREEISWAETEIDNSKTEADTWRRIIVSREAEAAHLMMRLGMLREDAELARQRSYLAAEEAREPTRLAEGKYREAYELAERVADLEERARTAEEEALEITKEAMEPTKERQAKLREAADAESVLKQVDAQVDVVAGKIERQLAEAEHKATTAASLAERAQRLERDLEIERKYLEAENREIEMQRTEQRAPMPVPAV